MSESTSAPNNGGLTCFKRLTSQEYRTMLAECSGLKWLAEEAQAIEKYPDFKFSTADERTFGVFQDGERILRLLQNESVLIDWKNEPGVQEVKNVAGLILEIGSDNPPFIFSKQTDLIRAWDELHKQFDVPPTVEEWEGLLCVLPPDPQDE